MGHKNGRGGERLSKRLRATRAAASAINRVSRAKGAWGLRVGNA
jgi:hypothetical protein